VITVYPLGQVGYLLERDGLRVLIDPYLYDSVADQYGEQLRRMVTPTLPVGGWTGVDWLLLTHGHLDHADPASLQTILRESPQVRVICPREVIPFVREVGFSPERISLADEQGRELGEALFVRAIPAAHTRVERDETGALRCVGYLLKWANLCCYHAGDTVPAPEIFSALAGERIDFAFLPVNERNYFRDENGIVGNMTVREAIAMADRLGAHTLVPTHWDLFAPNSTTVWEIEGLHAHLKARCRLRFLPCGRPHRLGGEFPA
jgi:L-ascorbate metabolism protein UlaG (beta-lactamase superfamily)